MIQSVPVSFFLPGLSNGKGPDIFEQLMSKVVKRSPSLKIERESCKLDYVFVIPMDVEIQC